MKQYLSTEEAIKLRALGYPARTHFITVSPYGTKVPVNTYSVGDLLEFLPISLGIADGYNPVLRVRKHHDYWLVGYSGVTERNGKELVDALYALATVPAVYTRAKRFNKEMRG